MQEGSGRRGDDGGRRSRGDDDGGGRSRRGLVVGGVIAAVLILGLGAAFALGVFGGDDGGETAAPVASTNVQLEPGEVTVYWPGLGPAGLTDGASEQIMGVIGDYIDKALVPGLRKGKVPDAAMAELFDAAALPVAQAAGVDRDTLFDEGLPKATGKLDIATPPVAFTALNDQQGATLLVAAALDLSTTARSAKGRYEIKRTGELIFAPDGAGGWKITGWTLDVERTGNGIPPEKASTSTEPAASETATTTTTIGTP
jgi:hypothetical protein